VIGLAAQAAAPAACKSHTCFDYIASSGRLAQLTGVLTALTFTAIIFLAGRERSERDQVEQTLVTFLAAFISLAVATFLYANAASEEQLGGRGAFVNFCASIVFAIAIQLVLLGITRLVSQGGYDDATSFAASVSAESMALIVFSLLSLTAIDAAGLRRTRHDAFVSSLAIACAVLLAVLIGRVIRMSRRRESSADADGEVRRFATRMIVFMSVVTVASGVAFELDYNIRVPDWVYFVFIMLLFVSLWVFCRLLFASVPKPLPAAQAPAYQAD